MWQGPLSDCVEPTREALRQLLACPEAFRPFVIVESRPFPTEGALPGEEGPFVQFAGSTERGLLLDVPALGIVAVPCPTPEEGARQVLALLRKQGMREDGEVRVRFESTRRAPGRTPGQA
jgi:hypothetical protein